MQKNMIHFIINFTYHTANMQAVSMNICWVWKVEKSWKRGWRIVAGQFVVLQRMHWIGKVNSKIIFNVRRLWKPKLRSSLTSITAYPRPDLIQIKPCASGVTRTNPMIVLRNCPLCQIELQSNLPYAYLKCVRRSFSLITFSVWSGYLTMHATL